MSEQEDALTKEILADAQTQAERVRRRAERELKQILAAAEKEAQAERDALLGAARTEVERRRRVGRARVEQDLLALRRQARHEMVESVRERACKELDELAASEGYRNVLVRLACAAIEGMAGDEFQIVLRDEDRERLGPELAELIAVGVAERRGRTVRVAPAAGGLRARGGLEVQGSGGHEVADQTFDGRMERLWPALRDLAARRLSQDNTEMQG